MPGKVKRLRVLAGPNGSGKSTVVFQILSNYHCGDFLNADELHKQLVQRGKILLSSFGLNIPAETFNDYLTTTGSSWLAKAASDNKPVHLSYSNQTLITPGGPGSYHAAIAADFIRYQLINQDDTFTFETVLSDERKIGFLKEAAAAGFKLYLYFVCTKDPKINKARVEGRIAKGGHYVPPEKIESRYYASLQVLAALIPLTHRCFLFDNSEEGDSGEPTLVAEIEKGTKLTIRSEDVPLWVEHYVIDRLFER